MKKLFIFMPLMFLIFLSPLTEVEAKLGPCALGTTSPPLLMTCISTKKGPPLFYSIEINNIQPQFMCDAFYSKQEAYVSVTDEHGDVVDEFFLHQYQYSFELKSNGSFFNSYDKNIFLLDCMYYQGGGQGGFSVGN